MSIQNISDISAIAKRYYQEIREADDQAEYLAVQGSLCVDTHDYHLAHILYGAVLAAGEAFLSLNLMMIDGFGDLIDHDDINDIFLSQIKNRSPMLDVDDRRKIEYLISQKAKANRMQEAQPEMSITVNNDGQISIARKPSLYIDYKFKQTINSDTEPDDTHIRDAQHAACLLSKIDDIVSLHTEYENMFEVATVLEQDDFEHIHWQLDVTLSVDEVKERLAWFEEKLSLGNDKS